MIAIVAAYLQLPLPSRQARIRPLSGIDLSDRLRVPSCSKTSQTVRHRFQMTREDVCTVAGDKSPSNARRAGGVKGGGAAEGDP